MSWCHCTIPAGQVTKRSAQNLLASAVADLRLYEGFHRRTASVALAVAAAIPADHPSNRVGLCLHPIPTLVKAEYEVRCNAHQAFSSRNKSLTAKFDGGAGHPCTSRGAR